MLMKIITIGRSSSNDINLNDSLVSRTHCQIIQDDSGNFRLIDTNSKNGTYVNGTKRHGEIRLNKSDVVRIGNTTLPWQKYFPQLTMGESGYNVSGTSISPQDLPETPDSTTQQSGLGTIALILSIIGAGLLIFCAVKVMNWGLLAFLGRTQTYIWISVGINIIAYILTSVADYKNHKDSDAAGIAEWISGSCIFAVIAFYLWIRFGDPNTLNPFNGLFE